MVYCTINLVTHQVLWPLDEQFERAVDFNLSEQHDLLLFYGDYKPAFVQSKLRFQMQLSSNLASPPFSARRPSIQPTCCRHRFPCIGCHRRNKQKNPQVVGLFWGAAHR